MVISRIFGERCVRCGVKRTKNEFEGLPTCDACERAIAAERETKRACPTCQSPMHKEIVLNVIIDKCPSCHGAWLDGGELELLKKSMESGLGGQFATGLIIGMAMG
jgi:hypothetical protein